MHSAMSDSPESLMSDMNHLTILLYLPPTRYLLLAPIYTPYYELLR